MQVLPAHAEFSGHSNPEQSGGWLHKCGNQEGQEGLLIVQSVSYVNLENVLHGRIQQTAPDSMGKRRMSPRRRNSSIMYVLIQQTKLSFDKSQQNERNFFIKKLLVK